GSNERVNVPTLRISAHGDHADGCLPVLLRLHQLRDAAQAESRSLLRVLLVRIGRLPTGAGGATMLPGAGVVPPCGRYARMSTRPPALSVDYRLHRTCIGLSTLRPVAARLDLRFC